MFFGGVLHDSSVSNLEVSNVVLSTEGDSSAGLVAPMLVGPGGNSTTTTTMSGVVVTTLGADSSGIVVDDPDVDMGGPANSAVSSRSHSFENLDVSTAGDRSMGLTVYGFGDGSADSDTLIFLNDSIVKTEGHDSTGILLDIFGDGLTNDVIILVTTGTTIETEGDRSAGLIIGDGLGSNIGIVDSEITLFLGDLDIATLGDDAIGLIVEPGGEGAGNFRDTTLAAITVSTAGDRSHGIVLGKQQNALLTDISITTTGAEAIGLLARSDLFTNDLDVTVSTTGAGATGMYFDHSAEVATELHTGFEAIVTTEGDDAAGIVFGELGTGTTVDGDASFIAFNQSATIGTTGDRAPGLVFGGIGTGAGDAFLGLAGHTYDVTTLGEDSAGIIFNALGEMTKTQEAVLIDMRLNADTVGHRSPGVIFGATRTETPSTSISSFQAADVAVDVTTMGDNSTGFFFGPGALPSGDYTVSAVSIGGTVVT
jgi:hypothetical protein